jgi:transposase
MDDSTVPKYNDAFKAKMVQRLAMPGGPTAATLSVETGVTQSTLSRWVREARKVRPVQTSSDVPDDPLSAARPARRVDDWTAEERLRVVIEASRLPDEDLGVFLRREGLHQAQMQAWQATALEALQPASSTKTTKATAYARRVRDLEKELRRKDSALAEAAALLVLSKKIKALWGDGDDATSPRSAS